jgi:hypothetical protein
MVTPKKRKKILNKNDIKNFSKKIEDNYKDSSEKVFDGLNLGQPVGIALNSAKKAEGVEILISSAISPQRLNTSSSVKTGDAVALDENGEVYSLNSEVFIGIDRKALTEILQVLCSDLANRDVLNWKEDLKNDRFILAVKRNKDDKPNKEGFIGELCSPLKLTPTDSFRRVKKIKQASGKYVFKKVQH